MSTCSKCGSQSFRMEVQSPVDSLDKFYFVQCSSCGVPVGVVDYLNYGPMLEGQKRELAALSERLLNIEHLVKEVVNANRN